MKFSFLLFLVFVSFDVAWASYPGALPNKNIKKNAIHESGRKIPHSDIFAAVVDGQAYLRGLGAQDFYHGVGYWMQVRAEASPHPYFDFNLRSVFFLGNNSAGYTEAAGSFHLVGLTGRWPDTILGGNLTAGALDVGRQTLGKGLFIQNREFFDGYLLWNTDSSKILVRANGTGAIVKDDDLVNFEIELFSGAIGLGAAFLTEKQRQAYAYLFSDIPLTDKLNIELESGMRNKVIAGLLAINWKQDFGNFKVKSRLEGRWYGDDFGVDIVGDTDQDFVAYEQLETPFTNSLNLFTDDDHAIVYALHLDLHYRFNDKWGVHVLNELGNFDYQDISDFKYYFYRAGLELYPFPSRVDKVVLFASNKVLVDSFFAPPTLSSTTNNRVFEDISHLGLEAHFKF